MTPIEYAVVLTSCGRFDLLRRTVESFLRFADVRPRQFIVVEDSGDEKVREVLAEFDYPFEIIVRPPRVAEDAVWGRHARQAAAIDAGYARVKTPLIFHCEDDWLFFRGGFIRESFVILQKFPKASIVSLCGREKIFYARTVPYEEIDEVLFFRDKTVISKSRYYYSYIPGLRRMSDYRLVAPLAEMGDESLASRVFGFFGFYMAHLEIPAIVHLGYRQRTLQAVRSNTPAGFLRRKIRRWRRKKHERAVLAKWRAIAAKSDNLPELQK